MIRRSWRTQLKATTSQQAVLSVVSQYLEEWSAAEIAALPAGAWPENLSSRSDVLAHTFNLGRIHSEFKGDPASLPALQELLLFFTHAGVRITQLALLVAPFAQPSPQKRVTDDEE